MVKGLGILMLCIVPVLVQAASQEVMLLPARPGKPSEIIYPDKLLPGVEYLIQYDGGESNYYLSGLSDADTFVVWFQPPVACSLLAVYFQLMTVSNFEPTPQTYEAFAAYADQSVDYVNDYDEYHGPGIPGPSPIDSFIEGPTTFTADSMDRWGDWDTLPVTSQPDIGMDAFLGGFIIGIPDSTPNPRIDAGMNPPYHTLIWRERPGGGGDAGWYHSWHLWWIRALVKIYDNEIPYVWPVDHLSDSYLTTDREVTAHAADYIGVPADSHGVAWVKLFYTVNAGPEDTVEMTLISGDSLDGWYSGALPGVPPYDTVTYHVEAQDYNGGRAVYGKPCTYTIREGTPGNILLLIEGDAYYGTPYSHDPVSNIVSNVDLWDGHVYGEADSSVLYYYHPATEGLGQPMIFWFTFSGVHFAEETAFLGDFLDAGGNLFVSCQDLAGGGFDLGFGDWVVSSGHFLYDYMKVYSGLDDYHEGDSSFTQYGVPGDAITGATNLSEVTVYPYYWSGPGDDWSGRFDQLDTDCLPIFHDEVDEVMGYRYEDPGSGYKIVWIYWPVHYIVVINGGIEDNVEAQDTLIARTLDWFGYETDVEEEEFSQTVFFIARSSPNPFKDKTLIEYELPRSSSVDVVVYNLLGQEVRTLVDREQSAGIHTVVWDARDNSGRKVSSGPYFLRFTMRHTDTDLRRSGQKLREEYIATRKLSVMK